MNKKRGEREHQIITVMWRLPLRGTIQAVFHLPGWQAEGFLESLFTVMGIELEVPDHSTLSRRTAQVACIAARDLER